VHCDVVIVGYRLNAKEPAAKALERILGLTPETARTLARGFPSVVVENAPEARAEELREQLSQAGARVELRPRTPLDIAAPRDPMPLELATTVRSQADDARAPTSAAAESPPRAAPAPPRRERLPVADFSLDLELASIPAPQRAPAASRSLESLQLPPTRAQQAASGGRALPLPSPATTAPNYQLGDFGLARPRSPSLSGLGPLPTGGSVVAALPTAPTGVAEAADNPSAGGAMELDLELGGALELELDHTDQAGSGMRRGLSDRAPDNDHHSLDDRFELAHGASVDGSALDERDARPRPVPLSRAEEPRASNPRAPRPPEVRRSLPPQRAAKAEQGARPGALGGWVPSLLLLATMCVGSLAAVGYAIDPGDVLGALQRERAAVAAGADVPAPSAGSDSDALLGLHPLLRATPAVTRAPLAAILRARIPGVHEVPVSFGKQGSFVHCALVEQAEGQTETRLARLRETGREVPAPSEITAQLREHERALRAERKQPELRFTEVCLTL
jgi:hypothetical protein